ncbi:MAG TPA: hypothetical protein VNR38_08095 [Ureibacillus sp.]|nr:hypothetical protein [Ureibacillus sp.]
MRKVVFGLAIITVIITMFLIFKHKHRQVPTINDVTNITSDWGTTIEEIYLVKKIEGEWLTIFRDEDSMMIARLVQNWFGYWEIKDDLGSESTLASSDYPPSHHAFNWTASESGTNVSYYFGQINNPTIKRIEVETQKNSFEVAKIISSEKARFFFIKSNGEMLMPINISGYSETGELIYSTNNPN